MMRTKISKHEQYTRRAMELLTEELVQQNSVTLSRVNPEKPKSPFNEMLFAKKLKSWFDARGIRCILQDLDDRRKNVFAFVKGKSTKTIVLTGHLDTVGTPDSEGSCATALNLNSFIPTRSTSRGKYIIGRGALDMKSGLAVAMTLMDEWNRNPQQLNGSVLLVATCDEENESYGMLNAIDVLLELKGIDSGKKKLKKQIMKLASGKTFHLLGIINLDYTTERYPGDPEYHVWNGTIGKVLPCIYVHGIETHVGEYFSGFHASNIVARIVAEIDGNMKYSDASVPPTVLKYGDMKNVYSVMTTNSARAYFNFFTTNKNPSQILNELAGTIKGIVTRYLKETSDNYKKYCQIMKLPKRASEWNVEIVKYSELLSRARRIVGAREVENVIQATISKNETADDREKGFEIIHSLVTKLNIRKPCVVVFYSPPFYPHVKPDGDKLGTVTRKVIAQVGRDNRCTISMQNYYPYISDMSYLKLEQEIKRNLDGLSSEIPVWGITYSLDLEKINKLNLSVVNIGPHGFDAHKSSERVDRYYSFTIFPEILRRVVKEMLK